jgi:hypothetical protein
MPLVSTSRRVVVFLGAVLVCLAPGHPVLPADTDDTAACGAPGVLSGDVRVTTNSGSSSRPRLVWTGSEYGVVWADQNAADGINQILFTRLDASGVEIGDDVSTGLTHDVLSYPVLAWTGSEYGVAYGETVPPAGGGNWIAKVFFHRLDAAGSPIGSVVQVSDETGLYAHGPAIAWSGTHYAVAWEDYRNQWPWDLEIYFNLLDASGTKVGPDVRVSTGERPSRTPALTWTGTEYGVAWTDERTSNFREIFFARLDASGAKIGDDVRITNSAQISSAPSLIWTGTEYGLAWKDRRDGNWEIYFTRIDAAGNKIGGDVRISDAPVSSCCPSLAWSGDEYGVVWDDERDGQWELYFARIDAMGDKIGGDVRLTFHAGTTVDASAVRNDTGYAVAWDDDRDGGNREIYFNRIGCAAVDGDGDGAPAANDCDDTDPSIWPAAPQICDDGLNNDCNHPNWPGLATTNEVDNDGDGLSACASDCDDTRSSVWNPPGEARSLRFDSATLLRWTEPLDPGGMEPLTYDALLSYYYPDRFDDPLYNECVVWDTPDTSANAYYAEADLQYYLVRAKNSCPVGTGSLGFASNGDERAGPVLCP